MRLEERAHLGQNARIDRRGRDMIEVDSFHRAAREKRIRPR
jgi:hypothetical protein